MFKLLILKSNECRIVVDWGAQVQHLYSIDLSFHSGGNEAGCGHPLLQTGQSEQTGQIFRGSSNGFVASSVELQPCIRFISSGSVDSNG